MKRTLAWIGVAAIIIGFVALIYFTATGAPANVIMAILFCMLVIPVMIYAFIMITKLIEQNQDNDKQS